MDFIKNRFRQKAKFDFYVYVSSAHNLSKISDTCCVGIKRKEKESKTKFCIIESGTASFNETLHVSSSLFYEGEKIENKDYTIYIKGFGGQIWKKDVDISQFAKVNGIAKRDIRFSFGNNGPYINLTISGYFEGISPNDTHQSPPLSLNINHNTNNSSFMNLKTPRGGITPRGEDDDNEMQFVDNPAHEHNVSLDDRRKISLYFSGVMNEHSGKDKSNDSLRHTTIPEDSHYDSPTLQPKNGHSFSDTSFHDDELFKGLDQDDDYSGDNYNTTHNRNRLQSMDFFNTGSVYITDEDFERNDFE